MDDEAKQTFGLALAILSLRAGMDTIHNLNDVTHTEVQAYMITVPIDMTN